MKVQILQGINLEYKSTTVKIELDSIKNIVDVEAILDLVQSFHPIFMSSYEVVENLLIIHSKLPKVWSESANTLNKLSSSEITLDIAKEYILNTVIKKQVLSMSTIPILYAAQQLGYETTQFYTNGAIVTQNSSFNRHYCLGSGKRSHINVSFAGTGDSHIAQKTQKDKWTTNTVIERLGLPIAKWQMFADKEELKNIFSSYKMPVVIKPVGLVGGHGVSTNISTLDEAYKAVDIAIASINTKDRPDWQTHMMIQEQVSGEDYRVLVIDGKFRIATKRIPAFIIGDGIRNIRELIEETNKDKRRDISNPTHTLKPITIDAILVDYLVEQGMDLNTIPNKDERVQVRKPASMSLGGITEDFTDKVHPQIKYICETLAQSIHAYTLGVDVICEDISKPLTGTNGSIIEMNTMPEGYLNTFPVIGKQYPETGAVYVKGLLEKLPEVKHIIISSNKYQVSNAKEHQDFLENNCSVVVNHEKEIKTIEDILAVVRNKANLGEDAKIGVYQNGEIYINDVLINTNMKTQDATEALKINASLDVIVFSYPELKEVEEHGYGFDNVDLWIKA